jgi:tetratricopeptide (TPR) repeat protein
VSARDGPMPSEARDQFDFFLSRRGSVAAVAREVHEVLAAQGFAVFTQDYDIPLSTSFIEAMHEAIKASRDLVILLTRDYETSPYTRKEFTSFEAQRLQNPQERRIVVLRCEDVPLAGLLADNVYQDLVGVSDPEERRRRIVAAAEGHSQAVKPLPRPFIDVPPRLAGFAGRADALDRLDAILVQDKPAAVTQTIGRVAVQGLGGVGKTSLAVEYAHRFQRLHAGVCWCPAETRASLLTSLAALAVSLGAASAEEADVEKAARSALQRLAGQRASWLLIYDNVTSPQEIADLLPSGGARVLITSRFSDWGGWAEEVTLDVLPMEEAVDVLQKRAGRADEGGARVLAETLGGLPLALDHAAAFCRSRHVRFADYASQASNRIAAAPSRGAAYPRSVAATFDLAITAAVAQCAAAEGLMAFLAQCAPERIPLTLVEAAIDDETERLDALAALTEMSLVKHDPFDDKTDAVTVHRLVQAVGYIRSQAKSLVQNAITRLIAQLEAIYPDDGYDNPASWPRCAHLTPHLLTSCSAEAADDVVAAKCAELLGRAGSYLHGRGAYSGARPLKEQALAIREKVLGPEHPDTAETLNNLALLLLDEGNRETARLLLERALAINEKVFGPGHNATATSLNNLALLLRDQGDLVTSRILFERALVNAEKTLGPEHPQTAAILSNLGLVLKAGDDFAGARALFERALAIDEQVLGAHHSATASDLDNLGRLMEQAGDLTGARPLFERAAAITEEVFGAKHRRTAESLSRVARLLHAQGDLPHARALFERALVIFENTLPPDHRTTATCLGNLASVLHDRGELTSARHFYERALVIFEKSLGTNHAETAACLGNHGSLLYDQGDLAKSMELLRRALAIDEEVFGPEHSNTHRVRRNLARTCLASGQVTEALALTEAALAAHRKALGAHHDWTKDAARTTADVLDALGRAAGAQAVRLQYGLDGGSTGNDQRKNS